MMRSLFHLYKQLMISEIAKQKSKPKLQISIENLKILVILVEILLALGKVKGIKTLQTQLIASLNLIEMKCIFLTITLETLKVAKEMPIKKNKATGHLQLTFVILNTKFQKIVQMKQILERLLMKKKIGMFGGLTDLFFQLSCLR